MFLNIDRPDVYDLIFVDDNRASLAIQRSPRPNVQFDNYLQQLISCNKYLPIGSEYDRSLDMDAPKRTLVDGEQVPYPNKYDFSFDVATGSALVDVFLGRADIDNTPLSIHASKRLRELYELNTLENLVEQTAGRLNNDLVGILNGNNTIIRDFNAITVPRTTLGRAANFVKSLSGAYLPFSYLPNDINDPNVLLAYTSRQQKKRIKELLDQNIYRPELEDVTTNLDVTGNFYWNNLGNTIQFGASENDTNFDQYNPVWRGLNENGFGLDKISIGINDSTSQFVVWQKQTNEDDTFLQGEKSIIAQTQNLVNTSKSWIDQSTTSWIHEINSRRYKLSKGNAVTASNDFIAKDYSEISKGEFFRAWTKNRPYNRLSRAMRSSGLYNGDSRSVLQNNGLPKIGNNASDVQSSDQYRTTAGGGVNVKKHMLSIENLAWADFFGNLKPCEQGSGDLVSGNRGRIMWFAPYNLQYDESTSANWNEHDFIGRGEKVYTYNNSSRSMNLSFDILADHPSSMNKLKNLNLDSEEFKLLWERYVNGDQFVLNYVNQLLSENTNPEKQREIEVAKTVNSKLPSTVQNTVNKDDNFLATLLLSNNNIFTDYNDSIHSSVTTPILNSNTTDTFIIKINPDETNFDSLCTDTINYIILCIISDLTDTGLSIDDANTESETYRTKLSCESDEDVTIGQIEVYQTNQIVDSQSTDAVTQQQITPTLTQEELATLTQNECDSFSYLESNQPVTFNKLREKIDYFHPAFHSTTPENLNERLTFLLQCTRQGDSIGNGTNNTRNLAFGRPPVIILRLGDFIHSKAIVKSVNFNEMIDFDLNPEGIGIQPMMVKVSMNIDLIGGSSMLSPISRIQNALSFNFFANTEMMDNRADTITVKSGDEDNPVITNLDDNRYRQRNSGLENNYGETGASEIEIDHTSEAFDSENGIQLIDQNADDFRNLT